MQLVRGAERGRRIKGWEERVNRADEEAVEEWRGSKKGLRVCHSDHHGTGL